MHWTSTRKRRALLVCGTTVLLLQAASCRHPAAADHSRFQGRRVAFSPSPPPLSWRRTREGLAIRNPSSRKNLPFDPRSRQPHRQRQQQESTTTALAFSIRGRKRRQQRAGKQQRNDGAAAPTSSSSSRTTGLSSQDDDDEEDPPLEETRRRRLRRRVTDLAKSMVIKPISYATPSSNPVLAVLSDATSTAVDMAVEEVVARRTANPKDYYDAARNGNNSTTLTIVEAVNQVFKPVEASLKQVEASLREARLALDEAKLQAVQAMETVQAETVAQALEGAVQVVEQAEQDAGRKVLADIYATAVSGGSRDMDEAIASSLAFEDVDYATSEMAPPFLDEDSCLVPGEPVVRVEKAPENSRRIFAGVDIMASVDDVWKLLTDYAHLQDVVPNLSVNRVLEEYKATAVSSSDDNNDQLSHQEQCQQLAGHMKGSKLRQVGGAKIAGINFSARTTLEVREWPTGLPDFAHVWDTVSGADERQQRAQDYTKVPLQRYLFPRPFAVSSLPTRDITMQSVKDDDGEFRMYQGVWRMQPLPGCSPPGQQAMRLTYAVEISPRAYLPVKLVEGRIVRDLCNNLEAIRDFVDSKKTAKVPV